MKNNIKREVRFIYLAILKGNKRISSLREIIGLYEEYESLRKKVSGSDMAPSILKNNMFKINMPKYLQWIKGYLK